ncbi:MAG TPA: hypothetical protein VLC10_05495 [Patescibacteria group bacterium]|nr:hypothetical protein [Patescibacteria group bacterium]
MKPLLRSKKTVILLAVLALVLAAGEGFWLSRIYASARDRDIAAKKTEVAALIRERAAGIISSEDFAYPLTDAQQALFRNLFSQIQSPEIVRMKIWNEDQVVLWSNLSEIIGQKFPDNDEVKEAYRGDVVLAIEEQKAEHVSERQYASLAEIYVPLIGPAGKVIGVVEIYEPAVIIDRDANDEVRRAGVPAVTATVAAYVILAAALLRAGKRKRPSPPNGSGASRGAS